MDEITGLRIEYPELKGVGNTSVTLKTGRKPGITGRNYEVVSDAKGELELAVRDDVTVTLPEDNSLENASISISKGDVTVADLHGLRNLSIKGTFGDTELRDISVEKKITLESLDGRTTIKDAEAEKLALCTLSGNTLIDADIAKIEAETISGNISITAGDEGSISLSTVAGAMTVRTDTVPDVEFDGIRRRYSGPESDEGSDLKIRATSISGTLEVKQDC